MKKDKRLTLVLVTAAIGCLSLTGCDTSYHEASVSLPDSLDPSKQPSLKGLFPDSGFNDNVFNTGYTASLINSLTGYDVNYAQLTGSDADNVITNYLTSKTQYDFMKLGLGQFDAHVVEKAFLPLEDYLNKFGTHLKDIIPQESWDTATYDGHIYAIPETAFASMQDEAIIFSRSALQEVGITSVPSTVGDFTDALTALQSHFGASNSSYHAFSLVGAMPTLSCISDAFEVPYNFFVDGEGKIENYIYSDNTLPYLNYMNGFVRNGVLAQSWSSSTASDALGQFIKGNCSVVSLPYWYMVPLYTQLCSVNPTKYPTYDDAKADIGYVLNLRGDGTNGSKNQVSAKHQAGMGNAYMITIPWYMSENAAYTIDYMDKKIQDVNYKLFLTGREGEGFEYTTADDADGVKITYGGETKYYKLLSTFKSNIKDNSMYQTGGNASVGKAFWPLREKGFDCWSVINEIDENAITNPLSMYPVIPSYSKISIVSASYVMTYIQQAINTLNNSETKNTSGILSAVKKNYKTKYWTDAVDADVQAWYSSKKGN